MQPGVKVAIAICVLGTGIGLAMLFRKAPDADGNAGPAAQSEVTFRASATKPDGNSPPNSRSSSTPATSAEPNQQRLVPLGPVTPSESDLPPRLPPNFPPYVRAHEASHSARPDARRTKVPATTEREAAEEEPEEERTHKIADGDTLRSIAARYLDDGDRYLEVFQANRSVLASPDLLPIGAELKIPAKRQSPATYDPPPSPPAPSASTISTRSDQEPAVVQPKMVPVRSRR